MHRFGILFALATLIIAMAQGAAADPEFNLPEVVSTTDAKRPASKSIQSKGNQEFASPTAGATPNAPAGPSLDYNEPDALSAPEPAYEGVSSGRAQSGRIVEQITTVDEVTAAQIERSGASTLDEAVRLVPGVAIVNGGDGVPRINIRGFRTRNITLLIDGVPRTGPMMDNSIPGQFPSTTSLE